MFLSCFLLSQITAGELTLTGILVTAVVSLAGVVKMFWNKQETQSKDLEKRVVLLQNHVDECREDREKLRIELAVTNSRIDEIEKKT